jgi:hypothetical protein
VRREAQSVQQLVRLDVVRRGRHIGREQGGANEADSEGAPTTLIKYRAPAILASWRGEAPVMESIMQLTTPSIGG